MIHFSHDCPHCGTVNSAFVVLQHHENKKYNNCSIFSLLATCRTCDRSIIGDIEIVETYFNPSVSIKDFRDKLGSLNSFNLKEAYRGHVDFYPNHKPQLNIPENLPSEVENKMRTAEKLYLHAVKDEDIINSAGNSYRATLEKALAILDDNKDKSLNSRINQLVTKGILVQSMGDFAHRIRSLGNEATHDDIDLESLKELRLFITLFLQYVFTLPGMIPGNKQPEA